MADEYVDEYQARAWDSYQQAAKVSVAAQERVRRIKDELEEARAELSRAWDEEERLRMIASARWMYPITDHGEGREPEVVCVRCDDKPLASSWIDRELEDAVARHDSEVHAKTDE